MSIVVFEPRPVESPQIHDPEGASLVRRLDCRCYDGCLSLAVARDWNGFACFGCPAYDPRSRDEERERSSPPACGALAAL